MRPSKILNCLILILFSFPLFATDWHYISDYEIDRNSNAVRGIRIFFDKDSIYKNNGTFQIKIKCIEFSEIVNLLKSFEKYPNGIFAIGFVMETVELNAKRSGKNANGTTEEQIQKACRADITTKSDVIANYETRIPSVTCSAKIVSGQKVFKQISLKPSVKGAQDTASEFLKMDKTDLTNKLISIID